MINITCTFSKGRQYTAENKITTIFVRKRWKKIIISENMKINGINSKMTIREWEMSSVNKISSNFNTDLWHILFSHVVRVASSFTR